MELIEILTIPALILLGVIIALFCAHIAAKQAGDYAPEDDEDEDLPRVVVMQEVQPVLKRQDRGSGKR